VLLKYKQSYEPSTRRMPAPLVATPTMPCCSWEGAGKGRRSRQGESACRAESLQGVVGTAGVFNFSARDHGGLGMDAFEMQTVKNGKFVVVQRHGRQEVATASRPAQAHESRSSLSVPGGRHHLRTIYAIVAIGFNIIYNTTGIINFAQGEFVMLGGMIGVTLHAFVPVPLAIAGAVLATCWPGR